MYKPPPKNKNKNNNNILSNYTCLSITVSEKLLPLSLSGVHVLCTQCQGNFFSVCNFKKSQFS